MLIHLKKILSSEDFLKNKNKLVDIKKRIKDLEILLKNNPEVGQKFQKL